MPRTEIFTLLMVLAPLAACAWSQEQNRTSDKFRKEFLEKFHRTGLNTTPGDAMLLRILVEARKATRGIEVGTASGFGSLNMGIAFERNGGHLYSLDINPQAVAETRRNLQAIGLEKTVTVMEGNALDLLSTLSGEFDFIFIDAAKPEYLGYLKAIESKLKPGAVVVADNVILYEKEMADFLTYINNSPNYEAVTIRSSMEKGDGMLVAYKLR